MQMKVLILSSHWLAGNAHLTNHPAVRKVWLKHICQKYTNIQQINRTMREATGIFALICWLHAHAHVHSVAPYTQSYVNASKNLFVASSKWLWNAFERHSIAGDNHSKQLERSPAKRAGWGLIQRLLVVDWVYSSKGDGQVDMKVFIPKSSQASEELVWESVCVHRRTNVVYGIKDQSSFWVLTKHNSNTHSQN